MKTFVTNSVKITKFYVCRFRQLDSVAERKRILRRKEFHRKV